MPLCQLQGGKSAHFQQALFVLLTGVGLNLRELHQRREFCLALLLYVPLASRCRLSVTGLLGRSHTREARKSTLIREARSKDAGRRLHGVRPTSRGRVPCAARQANGREHLIATTL